MAADTERRASSATAGFFQAYPEIPPAYSSRAQFNSQGDSVSDDVVLANIVDLYLPDPLPAGLDQSLHDFARVCLDPLTLRLMVDCETNQPTLHPLNTFGEVNDSTPLHTSEGWRGLKDIQTRAGIVAHGYRAVDGLRADSYNLRIHQFALSYLWSPSCASVSCPAAMSDGAAMLLSKHLTSSLLPRTPGQDPQVLRGVLQEAYDRLISFDTAYAWTSGQWMTERPGGSDVSRTETVAYLASTDELVADRAVFGDADTDSVDMPLGPHIINGFKWFSSATDADMCVLLAQTPKGLSTFYAPMRRLKIMSKGRKAFVMNGVRISRLKNKLGTKGLPTAELEIKGMRGWLIGEEGRGVKEISAILNATRLWTACGAMGGWARGLGVARAYAKVRKIKGDQVLADNRLHLKWMATETVKYRACAHLAFLGVALLGLTESGWERAARGAKAEKWLPKDRSQAELLLRILTPVMKAQCSLWATWGLRECMESLGGVGYCENLEDGGAMNIARIFRDGSVNSIWEGTTNILGEDLVRVVKGHTGRRALEAMDTMISTMLGLVDSDFVKSTLVIRKRWAALTDWLSRTSMEEVLYEGREVLQQVQDIVCSVLLMLDAWNTQNGTDKIVAERWMLSRFRPDENGAHKGSFALSSENDKGDKSIFLGLPIPGIDCTPSKL